MTEGEESRKSRKGGWCGWIIVLLVVIVVVTAVVVTIKKKSDNHSKKAAPVPGPPGAIESKYSDALKIALQFFDVQKSGNLVNNKISWRGDSALKDGSEAKLDLSKGMYDAGDHMKFGFPMAFTATVLSWAILEYGDQMSAVKQLESAQDSLQWITDYLINAHPSENVLYVQVGDPDLDHKCWERPEAMTEKRPLTQVNESSPGTEVAAETAAALASASLVFKRTNPTYSSLLLKHAKQLFTFADTYRGSYSLSIPQVQSYYNSTGYQDELLWAATWLYHATGEASYFNYATVQNGKTFANWGSPTWFSWDNKHAGTQNPSSHLHFTTVSATLKSGLPYSPPITATPTTGDPLQPPTTGDSFPSTGDQVLLARVSFFGAKETSNSGLQKYRKTAEAVMCGLLPQSPTATSSRTDGGLIWISEWNSLQHPVASAFLAVIYSDYMLSSETATFSCNGKSYTPEDLRKFAISQVDYVLGDNPMKMSFLVGYGSKYPQYVHHRGASIPVNAKTGCEDGFMWLNSTEPNPNVAIGGLVGGPFLNETFIDSRNNSMQTEPSTYNGAVIVGLLSSLVTTSSVVRSFT